MNTIIKNESSIMADLLIVSTALALLTIYSYGARAAIIILISVSVCVLSDFICLKLRHKEINLRDMSSVITGIVLALMMPASVSYPLVAAAAAFSVLIGKQAFGGHGHEIFNSAAVGYLFVALSFPNDFSGYPKPFSALPLSAALPSETLLSQSITKSIIAGDSTSFTVMDILIGNFCGPMGAGFVILLIIGAAFLIFRRSISAISFFSQLAAVFCFSFGYYGYNLLDALSLVSGGMLLFGIIFLSCDYRTIPKTRTSRLMYGIIVGGITILFQFYGKVENAIVYAVIIAAPIGIELDRQALSFNRFVHNRKNSKIKMADANETISLLNGGADNDKS